MTTEVTISIPVTARFDGCFCSDECDYAGVEFQQRVCNLTGSRFNHERLLRVVDVNRHSVTQDIPFNYHRTRWCCETFGMGEQVKEPPVMQPLEDWMLE